MIIPVGLIARGISGGTNAAAEHAAMVMKSRALAMAFDDLSADKQAGRDELIESTTSPDACVVVLAGADWGATEVDLVRMTDLAEAALLAERPRSPYRESDGVALGAGTLGFHSVPPGRHRVRTVVDGRPIYADFVTLPREGVFRRWDRAAAAFVGFEPNDEAKILERLGAGELPLVSYLEQVGRPRMQAMITTSGGVALAESEKAIRALVDALAAGSTAKALAAVQAATAQLVGIPIASFARLTKVVGYHAFELASQDKMKEAWLLLQGALAVLPEDPTVLAILGELQIRSGAKDAGKSTLTRAIAREAGLEPTMKARVTALVGELEAESR